MVVAINGQCYTWAPGARRACRYAHVVKKSYNCIEVATSFGRDGRNLKNRHATVAGILRAEQTELVVRAVSELLVFKRSVFGLAQET